MYYNTNIHHTVHIKFLNISVKCHIYIPQVAESIQC